MTPLKSYFNWKSNGPFILQWFFLNPGLSVIEKLYLILYILTPIFFIDLTGGLCLTRGLTVATGGPFLTRNLTASIGGVIEVIEVW